VWSKTARLSKSSLRIAALVAAAITMQLVLGALYTRRPRPRLPAACSTPGQIEVLHAVQKKLQGGARPSSKNPHPPDSMAWAGWTIARLGGWTGYGQATKSRGPITIRDGLDRFLTAIVDGYNLAKNVCPKLAHRGEVDAVASGEGFAL